MAPTLAHALRSIIPSKPTADETLGGDGGPLAEASRLLARSATQTNDPSRGVLDPHDISNVGFFVLFALIGLGFVITGIWFFFWAKNGGFHFKENDWDDYKSCFAAGWEVRTQSAQEVGGKAWDLLAVAQRLPV